LPATQNPGASRICKTRAPFDSIHRRSRALRYPLLQDVLTLRTPALRFSFPQLLRPTHRHFCFVRPVRGARAFVITHTIQLLVLALCLSLLLHQLLVASVALPDGGFLVIVYTRRCFSSVAAQHRLPEVRKGGFLCWGVGTTCCLT